MKRKLLVVLLFLYTIYGFSQNPFKVKVNGIKINDSILVIVQKENEIKFQKWAKYSATGASTVNFSLGTGKWAFIIDATGYTFPPASEFIIPNVNQTTVTLTPLLNGNYSYQWEDDDSYVGHATQVYVNEPPKLIVLSDTILVPNDYSSIKLRNEFGVVLSNDKSYWSSEDSYRLYTALRSLPLNTYGEGSIVDFKSGKNVHAIFYLTNDEQNRDLTIEIKNGIKYVTISESAFTYADPQIVTLDGIRGKFYSKRLYTAMVNYYTNFASDTAKVDEIAMNSFGVRFMKPNQETETLMGEDASDFQEFFNNEKIEILAMFEEMPEGFHKINGLKYLVRRINGQVNPKYPSAPAIAWTGNNTIEFMSKAFNGTDIDYVRRLILHEKTHFLWKYLFDDNLKKDWEDIGGWFLDPTSATGWSTTNTTEFVSAYGHDKNPDEDMAESVTTYITNPDILYSRSVRKYEFIRDRVMHGSRYIAQIREDLTFTVYNLFPDYTYPGKIKGVDIDIKGTPEEDKQVTIEFKLNSKNPKVDGASVGFIRLVSLIGTIHDIWLYPENGSIDSVLVGKTTFNKYEKNGYWNISSLRVVDPVGNSRYENSSTIGFKLYIENPLEDIISPKWNSDFKMQLVTTTDTTAINKTSLKFNYSFYDDSPMMRVITRIYFPKLDSSSAQIYEKQIQSTPLIDTIQGFENGTKSNKHFRNVLEIPNYYPSGYYSVSMLNAFDVANNISWVYMVKDTSNYHIKPNNKNDFKDVRDSIYVKTPFPDYIAPEVDINNITITAQPTNPTAPDGETKVDISLLARDLSDFSGHEAGLNRIRYNLRDPLGVFHHYDSWNDNGLFDFHSIIPDGNSDWKVINLDVLLPKGSPPGKWGLSSIQTQDRAGNFRNYSFVEYVRFDVIPSDIVLTSPLQAEILDKVVNAGNADKIKVSMSCIPCKDKNYLYKVYSLMGGNVVNGNGIFAQDSIIQYLDLTGVIDGVIKLTVQVTDSIDQLIATKTTDYTKDTQLPKAFYLKTNLQNQGSSNLDDLVIDIVYEKVDTGGTYRLVLTNSDTANIAPNGTFESNLKTVSSSKELILEGSLDSDTIKLTHLNIGDLNDGLIYATLEITDPNENKGKPLTYFYYKSRGKISILSASPSNAGPIAGIDSVCYGEKNVTYSVDSIPQATEIIWTLSPSNAGTIQGVGRAIQIDWDSSFVDSALLKVYGKNIFGNGSADSLIIHAINPPTATAGANDTICENSGYTLSGSATSQKSVLWATSGDGSFDNATLLNTTYTPGTNDKKNGNVKLKLTAYALLPCGTNESDSLVLSIQSLPEKPVTPQGPTTIMLGSDETSDYTLSSVQDHVLYEWLLYPEGSGTILGTKANGTVTWNNAFTGTKAFVSITASNNYCNAVSSDSLKIILSPVGVSQQKKGKSIVISPNPTKGKFTITLSEVKNYQLTIVNTMGGIVLQKKLKADRSHHKFTLDLAYFPSGTYYLRFVDGQEVIIKKVIINKFF